MDVETIDTDEIEQAMISELQELNIQQKKQRREQQRDQRDISDKNNTTQSEQQSSQSEDEDQQNFLYIKQTLLKGVLIDQYKELTFMKKMIEDMKSCEVHKNVAHFVDLFPMIVNLYEKSAIESVKEEASKVLRLLRLYLGDNSEIFLENGGFQLIAFFLSQNLKIVDKMITYNILNMVKEATKINKYKHLMLDKGIFNKIVWVLTNEMDTDQNIKIMKISAKIIYKFCSIRKPQFEKINQCFGIFYRIIMTVNPKKICDKDSRQFVYYCMYPLDVYIRSKDKVEQFLKSFEGIIDRLFVWVQSGISKVNYIAYRVLGNINRKVELLLTHPDFTSTIFKMIDHLTEEMRYQSCWILSNSVCKQESFVKKLLQNEEYVSKLKYHFLNDKRKIVRKEIGHVFCHIAIEYQFDQFVSVVLLSGEFFKQFENFIMSSDSYYIEKGLDYLLDLMKWGSDWKINKNKNLIFIKVQHSQNIQFRLPLLMEHRDENIRKKSKYLFEFQKYWINEQASM